MSKQSLHFDGWGHPTLDHFSMLDRYAQDKKSVKVLREFLPVCYLVIPDVTIRFLSSQPETYEVIRLYPGGEVRKQYDSTPRVMEAFRNVWRGKKPGWSSECFGGMVSLKRKGFLIPLPYRVTVWRASREG